MLRWKLIWKKFEAWGATYGHDGVKGLASKEDRVLPPVQLELSQRSPL